ncbi:sensor histidine kinase [Fibrella aquatilis]|uniref:histidine kinase n=1 Tax=Fibrella aquatilis TaxID=2817059 RepID=A0A939GCK8_9BACT|nr:ATP-binding protein [Fibrella aquatilis]MBO0934350.1 GHKL domain-containing protein [Fibrella aquatilis]
MANVTDLKAFPGFELVPDEQLRWLLDHADEQQYAAGYVLHRPGDSIDHLRLLLAGEMTIGAEPDELLHYTAPAITGVLPFSRLTEGVQVVTVDTDARMLELHRDHLREMATTCYELTATLVQQMTDRVRNFTQQAQQEEKLASLGRLSAGLAHELNNPVSAIVRNADALRTHMRATPERFKAIMHMNLTDEQTDVVNEWLFEKLDNKTAPLTMLERSGLEDDLTDWLDDQRVPDGPDLANSLAEFRFTDADLDFILEQVGPENIAGVLGWVNNNLVTEKLVVDIGEASGRMATLVSSIKSYTHMDRGGGREAVALADGIRSTVTLLGHKIRSKNVTVTVDIPDDLPTIQGWPGELNQVWTNLIDNAIDAAPDSGGTLTIRSYVERDQFVYTTFTDNGAGIPDDIQKKIFEPFFTTKGIGKGSGLGLDIVQGVVRHHNGSIKLASKPGETTFTICVPISE